MQECVESVNQIAQLSQYHGKSLASDEANPKKTCVIVENKGRNRRESVPVLEK